MKKKMKRYEVGGEVEFETAQGPNKNIGDDVRARAMAAMEKGSSDEPAVPKKTAEKLTPKAAPKAEPKEEPKAAPKKKESSFKDAPTTFKKGTSSFRESPSISKDTSATFKDAPATFKNSPSSFKNSPSAFTKDRLEKTGFEMKKEKALGMKAGGKVSSASKRADGCATKGKTRGRMV